MLILQAVSRAGNRTENSKALGDDMAVVRGRALIISISRFLPRQWTKERDYIVAATRAPTWNLVHCFPSAGTSCMQRAWSWLFEVDRRRDKRGIAHGRHG